ncbi:hypothetical protein JYU34_001382 [Plutella xylostella]|uniref:Protein phosphatase inhibitor 2 n=1 Tax=Plutella xylostella TaxID=51655 RepID=A0ABQ7R3S7_PLUXY|nr:protein phosphatase inhibitor 2 isoform X2 [Plutella xylostella]KAG7311957.1 hypothetical protein JYU34_001382 [Plutella xylostella]
MSSRKPRSSKAGGILKTNKGSGPSQPASTSKRSSKQQRFDEDNIKQTYHPVDKDYGHIKVDEPPTPFSEMEDGSRPPEDELDANILAAKLQASMNKGPRVLESSSSSDSDDMSEEERQRRRAERKEFERRRKMHYNEGQVLKHSSNLI